eukprot:snap_masked-scaffold_1-processed-gene-12.32-mRNA-1 protein AED:1.00 eAED:1.00 QI:0/0/0/0/1/1/2/0/489
MEQQQKDRTIYCSVNTFLCSTAFLFASSFGLFGASIIAFSLTTQPIFFSPREVFIISVVLSSYYLLTSFCGFFGLIRKKELCVILMLSISIFGLVGQLAAHSLFFFLATGNEDILEDLGFGLVAAITFNNEQRLIGFSQTIGTEELWEDIQNDGNCCGVSIQAIAISVLSDGVGVIPQTHSGDLCSANQTLEDELNTLLQNINQDNLQDTITQGEENENFGIDTGFFCLDAAQILELTAIISGIRLYFVPKEKGGFFISPEVYLKNKRNNFKSQLPSANIFRTASARVLYSINKQMSNQFMPTSPDSKSNATSEESGKSSLPPLVTSKPGSSFKQTEPNTPPDLPPRTEQLNISKSPHNVTTMKSLKNPRYNNLEPLDHGLNPYSRKKSKGRRKNRKKNVEGAVSPSSWQLQKGKSFKEGLSLKRQNSKKNNKLSPQLNKKRATVKGFYKRKRVQASEIASSAASPSFLEFTKDVSSKYKKRLDENKNC